MANMNGVVAANPSNSNLLYVGDKDVGMQHSVDDDVTWQPAGIGLLSDNGK